MAAGTVTVGMAALAVGSGEHLCCHGLGSCVGVALWDSQAGIGGLAHVMLPESSAAPRSSVLVAGRYADTAIPALVEAMALRGASPRQLRARLVGGANMFSFAGRESAALPTIGERNLAAVEQALKGQGLVISSRDVGGGYGRSLDFNTQDGSLQVRTASQGGAFLRP